MEQYKLLVELGKIMAQQKELGIRERELKIELGIEEPRECLKKREVADLQKYIIESLKDQRDEGAMWVTPETVCEMVLTSYLPDIAEDPVQW